MDDLQLPGLLHLAFVRGPHPYARVAGIDAGSAQAAPGVAAVLLATDLGALAPKPMTVAPPGFRVPPQRRWRWTRSATSGSRSRR